jgi:hypothetical protein
MVHVPLQGVEHALCARPYVGLILKTDCTTSKKGPFMEVQQRESRQG